jgi:hypothetical protein
MAWLVEDAFAEFHTIINLRGDHRAVANTRKDWIVRQLTASFEILEALTLGSIPKYTALSGYADLDVMVVLHFGKHIKGRTPATVLQNLRTALGPGAGAVRRNGQAVTMKFKSWPDVDVVPASVTYSDNTKKSVDHYNIPDMNRGVWLPTKPRLHAKAVNTARAPRGRSSVRSSRWSRTGTAGNP